MTADAWIADPVKCGRTAVRISRATARCDRRKRLLQKAVSHLRRIKRAAGLVIPAAPALLAVRTLDRRGPHNVRYPTHIARGINRIGETWLRSRDQSTSVTVFSGSGDRRRSHFCGCARAAPLTYTPSRWPSS
jgi:hypothetical protein